MNSVYGAVHSDMVQCMHLLARLSYILGDPAEALSQQHKATLLSERCNGLDSANTVIEYVSFVFSFPFMGDSDYSLRKIFVDPIKI